MKVIIAGSRSITDSKLVEQAIVRSGLVITEAVSGRARGVDRLGELWARFHNVNTKLFPADWDKHGRAAGFIRNHEMGDYADAAICVWNGVSRGTRDMIECMQKLGKPVFVFNTNTGEGVLHAPHPEPRHAPAHPVVLDRGEIGCKPGVDITVKSAQGEARHFAPDWGMVRGHQCHLIDNAEYTRLYTEILEKLPIEKWRWLTSQAVGGTLTLLCYCPDERFGVAKFCHTHCLIFYMLKRWPQYFRDGRAFPFVAAGGTGAYHQWMIRPKTQSSDYTVDRVETLE